MRILWNPQTGFNRHNSFEPLSTLGSCGTLNTSYPYINTLLMTPTTPTTVRTRSNAAQWDIALKCHLNSHLHTLQLRARCPTHVPHPTAFLYLILSIFRVGVDDTLWCPPNEQQQPIRLGAGSLRAGLFVSFALATSRRASFAAI